jgi:hypothetical protein
MGFDSPRKQSNDFRIVSILHHLDLGRAFGYDAQFDLPQLALSCKQLRFQRSQLRFQRLHPVVFRTIEHLPPRTLLDRIGGGR